MQSKILVAALIFGASLNASAWGQAPTEVPMNPQEHAKLENLLNKIDQPSDWSGTQLQRPGEGTASTSRSPSPLLPNTYRPSDGVQIPQPESAPMTPIGQLVNSFGRQYGTPLQSALRAIHVQPPAAANSPWLSNIVHFFTPPSQLEKITASEGRGPQNAVSEGRYGQQDRADNAGVPYSANVGPADTMAPGEEPLPGDNQPMGFSQMPSGPQNPFNLTPFGMLHYIWDDTNYVSESNPVALYEVQNDMAAVKQQSALARSAANRARYAPTAELRAQAAQEAQYHANLAKQYAERARVQAGEGSLNPADIANMATQEAESAQMQANTATRGAYGAF